MIDRFSKIRLNTFVTIFVLLLLSACGSSEEGLPQIDLVKFHQGLVEHPADIIEIDDGFAVSELLKNRVVLVDQQLKKIISVIDQPDDKPAFSAPHYFAKTDAQLLFSEGWGHSIYAADKENLAIQNRTASRQNVRSRNLNAPHGICVQGDWLYIAEALNSRILRLSLNSPDQIEIFSDNDKKIALGRQLLCTEEGLWVSNSYEDKAGLNPGQGSNVMLIRDFESGVAETLVSFPNTNSTGIAVVQQRYLLIGQMDANQIALFDLQEKKLLEKTLELPDNAGAPYGIYYSQTDNKIWITFIGDIYNKDLKGGVGEYDFE